MNMLFTSYSYDRWEQGGSNQSLGEKCQRLTFLWHLVCIFFSNEYLLKILISFTSYYVHIFKMLKGRQIPRRFKYQLSLVKISKGRCPIELIDWQFFRILLPRMLYKIGLTSLFDDFLLFWNIISTQSVISPSLYPEAE